jgi:hypothetical protein
MTIRREMKRASTVVLGGLFISAECLDHIFNPVTWHTLFASLAQILHLLHTRSSLSTLFLGAILVTAAVAGKTMIPAVLLLVTPELLDRYLTDRLRARGWWARGLQHRRRQRDLIVLGLCRRSRFA